MNIFEYYRHPQYERGVESHWFHQQSLRRVPGRLATNREAEIKESDFEMLFGHIKRKLTPADERLLACLGTSGIPGVVGSTNWDEYAARNLYILRHDEDRQPPDLFGIAGPLAQRSVERREAMISVDNRVYLDHTVKGVGLTQSRDFQRIDGAKRFREGEDCFYDVGYAPWVGTDLIGSLWAMCNKIDCPQLLPPIIFDDKGLSRRLQRLMVDGTIPYFFLLQRGCATNLRIASLYPAASLGIRPMDLKYITENAVPVIAVSRSLVDAYMYDVRVVRDFNAREGTTYRLGNSDDFTGGYGHDDFVGAFQKRFGDNVAKMVYKGQWHRNFIPHNTFIDGAVGDWDDWVAYDQRKRVFVWMNAERLGTEPYSFDQEQVFSRDAVRASFYIAAFVQALYLGEPMTLDDWWEMVRSEIPGGHWSKSYSYNDLGEIHYMDRQNELLIQERLMEFAEAMRKKV